MAKVKSQFRRLYEKRTVRTLVYGFLLYLAVTFGIHYFAFFYPHSKGFDSTDWRELSIALWANAIFAGTFGLLAAIVSLFRPEEDSLDKRIGYLYPLSSTLSGEARSRLGRNAMKLAAPAVAGDFHFVIESFDESKNAFWITAYMSFTLRNVLQDEYYEDEIEINVTPDEVPDTPILGKLIESSLVCSEAQPNRVVHACAETITATSKRFQQFVTVSIPPKAEAIHSHAFSAWCLRGVPWTISAARYSENIRVLVSNKTDGQISCTLSRGTSNPTIAPDPLVARKFTRSQDGMLKDQLVLDGSRENLQLLIDV